MENKTRNIVAGLTVLASMATGAILAPKEDFKLNSEDVKIVVQAKIDKGDFSDAIYYTPEEFDKMSDEEVLAQAQERIDTEMARREERKNFVPPPLTEEELLQYKKDLQAQKILIDSEILKINSELNK